MSVIKMLAIRLAKCSEIRVRQFIIMMAPQNFFGENVLF